MTDQTLDQALTLSRDDETLSAFVTGPFSNGPQGQPPETGAPFGGLMAALCAEGLREGLEIRSPLRSLTVQFTAAARFEAPVLLRPRMARGGRRVAYAALDMVQVAGETRERLICQATATYGADSETVIDARLTAAPPPRETLDETRQLVGPMAPWFTRHVDYVFERGPNILGGNIGREPVERLWMRCGDGRPLDQARLCFLLDAIYPPAFTLYRAPPMMSSVDLRYDFLADPTPDLCPDGWAFFEFRMLAIGGGWSVDDCICWAADGTPLAVARQRRKLL